MVTGSQLGEGVLLWLEMQGVQADTLKRSNPQAREQDPGRELTNWLYGKNIATPDQQSPLLGGFADITKLICAYTN